MTEDSALSVSRLCVQLSSGEDIVDGVNVEVARGEVLGLVGESGSGKTTTALAILGYATPGARIAGGQVNIAGQVVGTDSTLRDVRGKFVSYVPQNPGTALNPSLRVIEAISDVIKAHRPPGSVPDLVARSLERVGLADSVEFGRRFPHQLSGGQQQRVCIAMALVCDPPLILLDEPTTGLDVVSQARILDELQQLRSEQDVAMLYVTHDLAVVAQLADRIAVMYAGRIVEEGPTNDVLERPKHPYTRGLVASIPDHSRPSVLEPMKGISVGVGERPAGCAFAPRCPQRIGKCEIELPELDSVGGKRTVRCFEQARTPPLRWVPIDLDARDEAMDESEAIPVLSVQHLRAEHRSQGATVVAASDVSFEIVRRACVALVGESGSGKTTIARSIAGLHAATGGTILLGGEVLAPRAQRRSVDMRRRIQMVFQDPADALNPRHTVRLAIGSSLRMLRRMPKREVSAEVARLLEWVRLSTRLANRYPGELSGGERQRVAIARALAAQPDVVICDEITSALDVSVQAAILSLLADLRETLGLSLLFITHDLGVVAAIADTVLVLERGEVCEAGTTAAVLHAPRHPYTQRLLDAAPSVRSAIDRWSPRGAPAALGKPQRRNAHMRPTLSGGQSHDS